MKISNSKKQLAQIIHENGGWRDGFSFAAQDGDDCAIWFYESEPVRGSGAWWKTSGLGHCAIEGVDKLPNWHQTILSRDEYLHLYPVAEAAPEPVVEAKPTIEQLAADYSNRKDFADRKQQEADAAKADADAKLAELVTAGRALGLVLSVAGVEPEPVITDWRDLRVGDVVEVTGSDNPGWVRLKGVESLVTRIGPCEDDVSFCPRNDDDDGDWTMSDNTEWRFIRRPAKGGDNA